jgi:sigma-B regulation protein RsbU (phosphoserine phosphatase)
VYRKDDGLVRDNDTSMFVTVFCAMIHLPTGVCRYASGGHNPPFVVRGADRCPAVDVEAGAGAGVAAGAGHARVESLPQVIGPLLGIREGMQFEEGQTTLGPADLLFLYTDGVTEAIDANGVQFEEGRTRHTLAATEDLTADAVMRRMRDAIRDFVGGEEPFDDITMLAVRCPEAVPPV